MSILPVLGHKPITSYFTRNSKRKEIGDKSELPSRSKRPKRASGVPYVDEASPKADGIHGRMQARKETKGAHHSLMNPIDLQSGSPTRQESTLCPDGTPSMICVSPGKAAEKGRNALPQTSPISDSHTPASVSNLYFQNQDFIPDVASNLLPPLTPSEGIVESSQSQLLTLTPRVRKIELQPTIPSFDIIIPSSQSQERELTIPAKMRTRTSSLSTTSTNRFAIPKRTLSDELFSVPIQNSILDDIFPNEDVLATPAGAVSDSAEPESVVDSENESLTPYDKGRWSPATEASQCVSYSSLPPEVWEFRKMFENGDESYPADFPESLRF